MWGFEKLLMSTQQIQAASGELVEQAATLRGCKYVDFLHVDKTERSIKLMQLVRSNKPSTFWSSEENPKYVTSSE
jgi:hypothetical protein